jgi:hypothetical protein
VGHQSGTEGDESSSKIERGLEEWSWLERMGLDEEVQPGEPVILFARRQLLMSYTVLSLLSLSVESCSIKLCIAVISFIFWAKHYKLADRTSLTMEHNLLPRDRFTGASCN